MIRALLAAAIALGIAAPPAEAIENPTVTGPIPASVAPGDAARDYPFLATILFPPGSGYVEEEFFVDGRASRYSTACPATLCAASASDTPAEVVSRDHPYRIRLVVRRPADPARFNGRVIVEWQNVTNNWELDVQWYRASEYFIREGYAWVGVGPQRAGVHGTPNGLRAWSPRRYGTLDVTAGGTITDDSLKWDIFSQAGQAIAQPRGVDPLGGLPGARTLIATGDSQSSVNLATYANAVHPRDPIYAAFVLGGPIDIPIRDDVRQPVLKIISEWDLLRSEARLRRPDTDRYVAWEIAGSSHSDYHNFVVNSPVRLRDVGVRGITPDTANCIDPARSRVRLHLVTHAAYHWTARWLQGERPPAMPAPMAVDLSRDPPVALRDEHGIARGGIRLADAEVPVALNTGWNAGGVAPVPDGACRQAGTHVPFDLVTLRRLYPSRDAYLQRVREVTEQNRRGGFLLPADAERLIATAAEGLPDW
ncbi:alpha/beta hydrolase domain-containing protein [Falsiroseomonas ponticola]|uniref:alpha/beta hydrolase domain-containing protein n=1 Tax=Falsiroseomonas ponticola TaxID=2786951 RepID=UPI001933D8A0|nr:alpha/beta hydrolase domain-containing protein [Roseomonas ponticola]